MTVACAAGAIAWAKQGGWGPRPLLPVGWSVADVAAGPLSALQAWVSSPAWGAESEAPVLHTIDEDAYCGPRRREVLRVDTGHIAAFVLGALVWPAADLLRLVRAWWLRHVRRLELSLGFGRPAAP